MNPRTIVLCAGMHRSGTSLTASLLQSLGVALPGELIPADAANLSGYFENRSIVAAQEQLLQDLGYWWPTEPASRGMPPAVRHHPAYRAYVDWLTSHLDALLAQGEAAQLAIKDPRTSLLLPAWREAAARLGCRLRLVICVRDPRDVCWSLVWRDGPSVGMGWSRAQRLWLQHYRALLRDGAGLDAHVVVYERWLQPAWAAEQLCGLAAFLDQPCGSAAVQAALARVRPEFNHGGAPRLPPVHRSLRQLHHRLCQPKGGMARWAREAERCAVALERHRLRRAAQERLHLLWLRTPWGRRALGPALDRHTLQAQLGSTSLRRFQRCFPHRDDLRPHPLISPAHLNQQRLQRGLPPLRSADDLFRHLLYPDLIPLDPHPWFDCRFVQHQTGQLGAAGVHPVLRYLRDPCDQLENCHPQMNLPWLRALGSTEAYPWRLDHLPGLVPRLHPGLVLADPTASFGDPSAGKAPLQAHEAYWSTIQATFALWPDADLEGPLTWLHAQPGVKQMGLTPTLPARGLECWGLPGHWEAALLAQLAGMEPERFRCWECPQQLLEHYRSAAALAASNGTAPQPPLLALTQPLLELILADQQPLPKGAALLNLVWPRPAQQSPWLHQLAQAGLILECRPAVRAYLQGLGLPAVWPDPASQQLSAPFDAAPASASSPESTLLLALASSAAEAQLAAAAAQLNPDRYEAVLRLDAQLQTLAAPQQAWSWLEAQRHRHRHLLWLDSPLPAADPKGHAVWAWAQQRGVDLKIVDAEAALQPQWLTPLCQ